MARLPDLLVSVHEIVLEGELLIHVQRERLHVWAEVDLLGLGTSLLLRSARQRAVQGRVSLALSERVPVEPGEPIWAPLREALASIDEQDSDVYFVVRIADGSMHDPAEPGVEVGTAHLNLEALFKQEHEPDHEPSPLLDDDGNRVGVLTVSLGLLAAMRHCQMGEDGASIGLGVRKLQLVEPAAARLDELLKSRALRIDIEMPDDVGPMLSTPAAKVAGGAHTYDWAGWCPLTSGGAAGAAMLSALESKDGADSDVIFNLVLAGTEPGQYDRELGRGVVNLREFSEPGADESVARTIKIADNEAARGQREIGTLTRPCPCESLSTNRHPTMPKLAGTLNVTLTSLSSIGVLVGATKAAGATLQPPTLRSLLRAHVALSNRQPLPPLTTDGTETPDAVAMEAATAAAKAHSGPGLLWDVFDALHPKPLHKLTVALARRSAESEGEHAERTRRAMQALLDGADALSTTVPSKADFAHDSWPRERIERLWHLCSFVTDHARQERRAAHAAVSEAAYVLGRLNHGRAAASERTRRRLREAAHPEAVHPEKAAHDGRTEQRRVELILAQDAYALREVAASYERLMRGMLGTMHRLVADHLTLATLCDQSEVLMAGQGSPVARAAWAGPALARYANALQHATASGAPPPTFKPRPNWVPAPAASSAKPPSLEPEYLSTLSDAVSAALGEPKLVAPKSAGRPQRSGRWGADDSTDPRLASVDDSTPNLTGRGDAPELAALSESSEALPGRMGALANLAEVSETAAAGTARRGGTPHFIDLSARKLRLLPELSGRIKAESLKLLLALRPLALRLPALSTPGQAAVGGTLNFGYDGLTPPLPPMWGASLPPNGRPNCQVRRAAHPLLDGRRLAQAGAGMAHPGSLTFYGHAGHARTF